ncbi:hypothetical protein VNO78_02948 [Psophocarpus tetragonolobus]|uniref:Uncharacterized protein n=1 Tax=Psophocarpus tetragonolobus TaxID=3891 RepID=A0AAN9T0A0_PSOTE
MTQGSFGDNIGLKEELITSVCGLAFQAHTPPENLYHYQVIEISSETYHVFSFSGTWNPAEWFVNNKPFGETKIDLALFPSLSSIATGDAALVNEGFARRFDHILKTTSIKSQVNKAMAEGKKVVFTGHSSGAAIAKLFNFWALEEYLKPCKTHDHKPPFCVTFGSPLIGNHMFSHASRRENWSHYFIHFVLRYDIVPRILLAPFSSILQTFSSILQLLNPNFEPNIQDPTRASVISEFYSTVMTNAATVTSHAAGVLMGSTNLLFEAMANFVDLSPYRPFGTYVFCNGNGQLIVVKNSDAVFQLLLHIAQLSNLEELPEVSNVSILQHRAYKSELDESLGMQNIVYLEQLDQLPLSPDGSNSDVARVSAALDGLGLSPRARLCLWAAAELEKKKCVNENSLKEKKALVEKNLNDLVEYREFWLHQKVGFYDGFKEHKKSEDFKANVKRLELAGVLDEMMEKVRNYELPDEFEGKEEWIVIGNKVRELKEPLDIANYYRHGRHYEDASSSYMVKGRPKRYRYPQRWLEHKKRTPFESLSPSCFWAEVEELRYHTSKSDASFQDVKERVEKLEAQIKAWNDNNELAKDVFLEGSTLVKWWKTLPPEHKQQSCIKDLIKE